MFYSAVTAPKDESKSSTVAVSGAYSLQADCSMPVSITPGLIMAAQQATAQLAHVPVNTVQVTVTSDSTTCVRRRQLTTSSITWTSQNGIVLRIQYTLLFALDAAGTAAATQAAGNLNTVTPDTVVSTFQQSATDHHVQTTVLEAGTTEPVTVTDQPGRNTTTGSKDMRGTIAGSVVGSVVGFGILLCLVAICLKRRNKQKSEAVIARLDAVVLHNQGGYTTVAVGSPPRERAYSP